ncbi:hypothetical protein C443_00667 [Haloarcula argentinensis DSM 12282]|uniref:Uncharacterized protein n=1 Tax=Haloarcula argentinensis TaxID=43776 RepID=A0A830FX44_HALAR|nr:hypothetical protein C443_00667 [Haloarcula argentinensis DSM 12282]GGM51578.1 hypothetical protein GCM10009006_35970 [Haloarcula argentinensis]
MDLDVPDVTDESPSEIGILIDKYDDKRVDERVDEIEERPEEIQGEAVHTAAVERVLKNSFDSVLISVVTHPKPESSPLQCSLDVLSVVDEKDGSFNIVFVPKLV